MGEIIIKKNEAGNDASAVDGIGARFARMPYDIYARINSLREFDWVFESPYPDNPNWGIAEFIRLNPQFFVTAFDKFSALRDYPSFIVNKDGSVYNLRKMCWVSKKMKGHWSGK